MQKAVFAAVLGLGVCALATPAAADGPLLTEIVVVEATPQAQDYSLTGEVRARDSVSAAFPVAGRVVEIFADEGETVAAGQVLARLDAVQQQQALRAAEAGLTTAEADQRQAADDLAREEELLARGATTRAARNTASDKLHIADGTLGQARAELDRAQKALADTELTAPAAATVTARMAEAGQVVGAAQPVMDLALSTGLEAVFQVPEVLLTGEAPPADIRLTRLADPATAFSGTISEIAPLVDERTGTVEITVRIDNPPPGLTYGEAVRGTATVTEPGQIVLPYTVLSASGDAPAVWTVDPETRAVTLTPIEVERYLTGRIVVASGLGAGDLVVARGAQFLFPGRVVQAVGEAQ
ncbi:MAG: efflux RND transporter periplasmic adaptor subunit [Nitratireductor sp.]|nr:efflux RND transporter periplasmic adaptor subunit [Nitratireductor sp.]